MTVTVQKSIANGTVCAPPSKSAAHRALICGAFTSGSVIKNVAFSKDISATLDCLKTLGAEVCVSGDTVKIGGLNIENIKTDNELFCDESGSTLRFLLPVCMLTDKEITLSGTQKLLSRPLSAYEKICEEQKIFFEKKDTYVTVGGSIKSGEYVIAGDVSSQFITGLLFVLPLLSNDSKITVTGKFESESYVNLTIEMLSSFGVAVEKTKNEIYIKGGQKYSPTTITVEGDCSNAAFLDAFNLLGGFVTVKGICDNTTQGDYAYKSMFSALKSGEKEFCLSDCPDLAPVMFALSAAFGGAHFVGTRRLKIKESDRGEAMKAELAKFGASLIIGEDEITVCADSLHVPTVPLCSHNDHRIVMALTLLCSVYGGKIENAQAVNKSFPDFFEKVKTLGIGIIEDDT